MTAIFCYCKRFLANAKFSKSIANSRKLREIKCKRIAISWHNLGLARPFGNSSSRASQSVGQFRHNNCGKLIGMLNWWIDDEDF